jgi:hypothetical protein
VVTVDDNTVGRRSVRLGAVTDQVAQVTSGLSEGELVATANAANLSPGQLVQAIAQTAEVGGAQ